MTVLNKRMSLKNRIKPVRGLLFSAVVVTALLGCGGGSSTASVADEPSPPTSLQPDPHSASIAAIEAAFRPLPHVDPAADAESILAVVRGLPDVGDSGIEEPGNVWLTFKDGISTIITTTPLVTAADRVAITQTSSSRALAQRVQKLDTRLPGTTPAGSRQAFLLDAVARDFGLESGLDQIRPWLTAQGFDVVSTDRQVTPAVYKNIRDVSVLHLAAHGGVGLVRGQKVFVLSTGLRTDVGDNLTPYGDAIAAGDMGYIVVVNQVLATDPTLAMGTYLYITPSFVRKYMSFAKGSLVNLDACSVFAYHGDDMRKAFMDVGATTLVGWDADVSMRDGRDSSLYLFDRLLSANSYAPYMVQPGNRPFSVAEVFADMQGRQRVVPAGTPPQTLAQSPFNRATLRRQVASGYENLALVPSITGLYVENRFDRLTLTGNFGAGPGKGGGTREVTLGGATLSVDSWSPTSIVLRDVPRSGSGSNGELIVKVDGAKSNPAWVSQWNGLVVKNYQGEYAQGKGDGTAVSVVECTFNLRGSASNFRSELNGEANLFATTDDAVLQDSGTCSWDAYGTYFGSDYSLTYSVAGSKDLPWATIAQRANPDALQRYAYVTALISGGNLQIDLIARIRPGDGGGIVHTYAYRSGQTGSAVVPVHSSGYLYGTYFGADDAILAASNQQTLNFVTLSGAAAMQSADPNHAR